MLGSRAFAPEMMLDRVARLFNEFATQASPLGYQNRVGGVAVMTRVITPSESTMFVTKM